MVISETGHSKNIANFETLISAAQSALEATRISRNNILYNDTTGLVAIMK